MNKQCSKVTLRIECEQCGYPLSEARYPDDYHNPLPCDSITKGIAHINHLNLLQSTQSDHPYDCKCLVCR